MRKLFRILTVPLVAVLVACGGGGGSSGTTGGGSSGGTTGAAVAKVEVTASESTLSATNPTGVTITVIAKDAANNALASQPITLSASSGVLSGATATTGEDGKATAVLTAGSDTSNREITVTAKSGNVTGTVVVAVTQVASRVAKVEVAASATSLRSADATGITLSVLVKDASNNVITGQPVTFEASSGVLSNVTSATGADGRATAVLTAGSDRVNRDITVTVKAGTTEGKIVVPVEGTTLTVAGSTSLLVGATGTYAASLKDSSGNPIAAQSIAVTSSLGNTLTPAQATTDNAGAASFNYVASRSGPDVITLTSAGVVQTLAVNVSSINFAFTAPASSSEVNVDTSIPVTVRFLENGVGVAGEDVSFATTRGVVANAVVKTDANGYATTQVSSSSAGPATVSARLRTTITTLPMSFVALTPAAINLQVSSAALPPNTSPTTTNQVELRATVRDASGNAVKGVTVNFTAVKDLSGGRIKTGTAVTDANGLATDSFISGAVSTAANGVEIQATVAGTAIANKVMLTVSGQSLFINIAANNTIEKLSTTYRKTFSVQVNDANGAPVSGQNVTLSYYPPSYRKGEMKFENKLWTAQYSTDPCLNEDLNRDGQLSAEEDAPTGVGNGNGDGRLTPGLPGLIAPAFVTTNSSGSAEFTLEYGQQYAPWVDFELSAKVVVAGTESTGLFNFLASAASSDLTDETVAPAGKVSPFGKATSCRMKD